MAFDKKSLDDYVEVHVRVAAFYDKFPEGSLQSEVYLFRDAELTPDNKIVKWGMVIMKGIASRWAGDISPGIGFSSMTIPGSTPYTRGSEIENAETSAWGRALAALGFEVKRSIASANEIANKRTETPPPAFRPVPPTVAPRTTGPTPPRSDYVSKQQFEALRKAAISKMGEGDGTFKLAMWLVELKITEDTVTRENWSKMMKWVIEGESPENREPGDESQENLEAGFVPSMDLEGADRMVSGTMERVAAQRAPANAISEAQGKRLYAIAKGDKGLLDTILGNYGYKHSREILKPLYEQICGEVEKAANGTS